MSNSKTLLLLRHAKSSWDNNSLNDIDRPLNDRGITDASMMGKFIINNGIIPQLIISSPSKRTKMTLDLLKKEFNDTNKTAKDIPVIFDNRIYDAYVTDLFNVVTETNDEINNLMIIGHNPGVQMLTEWIIYKKFPYDKFNTCGLVILQLNIKTWKELEKECGSILLYKSPKTL